jgi:hypothetical protein
VVIAIQRTIWMSRCADAGSGEEHVTCPLHVVTGACATRSLRVIAQQLSMREHARGIIREALHKTDARLSSFEVQAA